LGVTDVALFTDAYAPLLHAAHRVASPDARGARDGETAADVAERALASVRELFAARAGQIAAIIVEPLVQCAAGMAMYHPRYLSGLRALCDEYAVHLIGDEIAVGCGRTGTFFACEQAGVWPDFLCLSKGISGGYLPLSAVLTRDAVFEAFYDDDMTRGFLHSHSYTGNPLACRAALATLDIFERENVLAVNLERARMIDGLLAPLHAHDRVRNARRIGMIWAWDIVGAPANFARRYARHALANGLLLRPIGSTLYAMPPYVLEEDTARHLADGALAALEATLAEAEPSLFDDERALP
jgi:adenosylmethionine-8-amino-7-oxononanoate aminotransferase